MANRVVSPHPSAQARSMAAHVHALQDEGRDVIFFTSNMPAARLLAMFEAEGVRTDRLQMLDAITTHGTHDAPALPNTTYLQSPAMLELVALRLEQMASRVDSPHVVLCCLNTLAIYNEQALVQEFAHYACMRFAGLGIPLDLILTRVAGDHEALAEAVAPYIDGSIGLTQ